MLDLHGGLQDLDSVLRLVIPDQPISNAALPVISPFSSR